MKTVLFLLVISSVFTIYSQEPVPRFQTYSVLETGCSYYLPESADFELSHSEDGAEVIVGEVLFGDFHFSTITVKFTEDMEPTADDLPVLVEGYLNYLMETMDIVESAGIGWGHTLESNPNAIGAIDYWVDSEGTLFSVKAWCDQDFLAILFLYGEDDYPYFDAQQLFLNGFRFP